MLQSPPCNKSVHTEMQLPEYFNALQSKQHEKIADVQFYCTRKLQMCNNKAVTKDQINDNFDFKSLLWYCKSPETFSTEVHKDEVTNAKWEWEKNRDETKNAWKQGTREGTRHSDIARKARGWETSIFTRRQWTGGT